MTQLAILIITTILYLGQIKNANAVMCLISPVAPVCNYEVDNQYDMFPR